MRRSGGLALTGPAAALALAVSAAAAAPALRSGPQAGQQPLPFTSDMVTGPYRGQQHCYICDLADEPAVLVFSRHTGDGTARLLRGLRDAVRAHEKEKLFGWLVILGGSGAKAETELERQAYQFARSNEAARIPVSVLGDPAGPPGYLIAPDAEVTVLFFRSGKVLQNHAYRSREWTARTAAGVLKDLPALLGEPPSAH